jgi:CheY-like chemotaxis protein/DNA-binding PadR family transcriptional regulator
VFVDAKGVFAVTEKGRAELDSAGTALSSTELELLVMIDGRTSVGNIMHAAPSLSSDTITKSLEKLARAGYIVSTVDVTSDHIEPGNFFAPSDKECEAGVATLKHSGYFVKIARLAAKSRQLAAGEKITVLVVEDDPQLAKLVQTYFNMEGFQTRLAGKRDEINASLRQQPKPDLILLDVMLPDIDGFDVLARLRQNETFKDVPVIMMTAKATREAVLKGLERGADGYVTKPFEIQVLLAAVKNVLGVKGGSGSGMWEIK